MYFLVQENTLNIPIKLFNFTSQLMTEGSVNYFSRLWFLAVKEGFFFKRNWLMALIVSVIDGLYMEFIL